MRSLIPHTRPWIASYRNLHDVLGQTKDPCSQVLRHPDWWQVDAMPPHERIFRRVFGRTESVMRRKDSLEIYIRPNHDGSRAKLQYIV